MDVLTSERCLCSFGAAIKGCAFTVIHVQVRLRCIVLALVRIETETTDNREAPCARVWVHSGSEQGSSLCCWIRVHTMH